VLIDKLACLPRMVVVGHLGSHAVPWWDGSGWVGWTTHVIVRLRISKALGWLVTGPFLYYKPGRTAVYKPAISFRLAVTTPLNTSTNYTTIRNTHNLPSSWPSSTCVSLE